MMNVFKKRIFPRGRARRIKMLILDVDGVLTDGRIIVSAGGVETKNFSVYDGVGINLGMKQGLKFAIITARKSEATSLRAAELGIEDVFQVNGEKLSAYESILKKHGLRDFEAAYMGDDLHDAAVMERAGLAAAPPGAKPPAAARAHYITKARGGEGAVREVVDLILKSKGKSLVLKAAGLLMAALMLGGCLRGNVDPPPAPPAREPEDPGERVEGGFHYTATEKGRVVMEIEGLRASGLGPDSPRIFIEKPHVKWFREDAAVLAGGEEGVLVKETNDIIFEDNAWVVYGRTGEISGDRIEWKGADSVFEAEGSVKGKFYFDMNSGGIRDED